MTDNHRRSADELQDELLAALLRDQGFDASAGSVITPAAAVQQAPLSSQQARLWFLSRLDPDNPSYALRAAVRVSGELRIDVLQRALDGVVSRHAALRTVFAERGGVPVQIVQAGTTAAMRVVNVAETPGRCADSVLQDAIAADASDPFDLAQGPLLRTVVLRTSADEHVIVFAMHHIVSDGWSMGVLIKDLVELYTAGVTGRAPSLPPVNLQYPDYAAWQHAWRESAAAQAQLRFWTRHLAALPTLKLPTDRPRSGTYAGACVFRTVDSPARQALQQLSRETGATLFMTLLSVFAALLHRYTGETDLPIGTPTANRGPSELGGVVGLFVNVLVLRVDVSGGPSLRTLVHRVQQGCLEAWAHADVPFEELVDALKPERTSSQNPLFQVMFVLQNAPLGRLDFPGLTFESCDLPITTARFDLTLQAVESAGVLSLGLEYKRDLFDEETAERLLGHYIRLLDAALAEPDTPVGRVPMMDSDERSRVIGLWSRGAAPTSRDEAVHERFSRRAVERPGATAIRHHTQAVTYSDLDRRASRLAQRLRVLGAGPGQVIGLAVDRSIELVVGLLGILKAGAAYLPLDLSLPSERLAFMIEDAGVRLVLSMRGGRDSEWRARTGITEVPLTGLDAAEQPDGPPFLSPDPLGLAYVIYTSGSTGQPRGVGVSHRALLNLVDWHVDAFGITSDDRASQVASPSFDASGWEIWPYLTRGAELDVADDATVRSPASLGRWLTERRITVSFLPTPLAEQVLDQEWHHTSLRHLLTGGDRLRRTAPTGLPFTLVNNYGPTEATVVTTSGAVTGDGNPSIGRPIAGVYVYVADGEQQPVPFGVSGELLVGGVGLARGYVGQPGLTAERYVPDALSGEPGARLYRTGDLVRWRPDGTIEFLGRLDRQVKIRGLRIEPGEIEALLLQHPGVVQAAVLVRELGAGDTLIAYVVPPPGGRVDPVSLRRHLAERLPEYMVPAMYMSVAALPLTPQGKLDTGALPEPESQVSAYRAARTADEEILCGLFAELLALPRAGVDDNFFEHGGHSLLSTRLVSRIRATLGVEVPVRAVFESPTVAELARYVRAGDTATRPPLTSQRRPARLPLSYAQARLWFLHRLEGPSATYNITAALDLEGPLQVHALAQAISDVVARHESLRTLFTEDDDGPSQTIVADSEAGRILVFETSDEAGLPARLTEAASTAIDLSRDLPLRAWLFAFAPDRHVLLLLLHHIAGDGWSMGPLAADVATAYTARCAGAPPRWAPLAVQYADYTLWQRDLLGREEVPDSRLSRQLAFWREALHGAPEELPLPADRPRPSVATYRGGTTPIAIEPALHAEMMALARASGATLFMVLQAALAGLLNRLGAGPDIPIGFPVAGRGDEALEPLVGFFVNTLVLRTDVSGDPGFRELVSRVRCKALDAFAHADVPFERVVEALQPGRSSRHPLFQVMLAVQNTPPADLTLPHLSVRFRPVAVQAAKFDLWFSLSEEFGPSGEPLGITGVLEYSLDLFDRGTAERLAERFPRFLARAIASPDTPLTRLDLLSAEERNTLLEGWNATAHRWGGLSLPALFELQVRRTPAATAVRYVGETLSYAALNERANRLAHHLIDRGVGPECIAGVALERSIELVVALLAVLKSGAAYLPLDPDYPDARLARMVTQAAPTVVIASCGLRGRLSPAAAPIVSPDDPDTSLVIEAGPAHNPADAERTTPLCPAHPAYVIFTSGSTGVPQGAVNTHEGVVNRIGWMQATYGLDGSDRVLQKTPFSFDVSVWELFWPLTFGAELVVSRPGGHRDPDYLTRTIAQEGVTTLHFVPSMLRAFLEHPAAAGCRTLRRVICSGEALPGDLQARFFAVLPEVELHNLYGPTEASIDVTAWACRPAHGAAPPPIGAPIWNTRMYVLDRHLAPAPAGIAGDLYIAGVGLARGYVRGPELTADRFVPDPHGLSPGARMYRTGDLARWRHDGVLEYLGRTDQQVKLRGFRIEVGEIEAGLLADPEVAQAAVVPRPAPVGQELVAYLVARVGVRSEDEQAWAREQTAQWRATFDDSYGQPDAVATDCGVDFTGWISSYTRQPIPHVEMMEWLEGTVRRVEGLRPRRILDVGCGTGLLLFRLAGAASDYCAVDFSRVAIERLQRQTDLRGWSHVRYLEREAADFTGVAARAFDTVILNSITQYFSSIDYLLRVIEGVLEATAPGGAVFIGDVRSFPLLPHYHASVQLFQAEDALTRAELQARVAAATDAEKELVLDPAFFVALQQRFPRITDVEVQLKQASSGNEMSCFRYDVVLRCDEPARAPVSAPAWCEGASVVTCDAVRERLGAAAGDVGWRGLQNPRVHVARQTLEWLERVDGPVTVGEFRTAMVPAGSVTPAELYAVAGELGWNVTLTWSPGAGDGRFDALFSRGGTPPQMPLALHPRPFSRWADYANNPLERRPAERLLTRLREQLSATLPEYMVPSAFVMLKALPLTQSGKLDRRALPAPERREGTYAPPRSALEEALCAAFAEVLGLPRVGIDDSFFVLGGHSLLAIRLVNRIRQSLGMELPVRTVFEAPAIRDLAARLHASTPVRPVLVRQERPARVPLSPAQSRLWFLHRLSGPSATYNLALALRLQGPLGSSVVEAAVRDVVERHESLRTVLSEQDGGPVQQVLSGTAGHPPFEIEEVTGSELDARLRRAAATPIDITRELPARAWLFRLGDAHHVLLLLVHHVAADGWSMQVLSRDLSQAFGARTRGAAPGWPPLPVQYADYTLWQRALLGDESDPASLVSQQLDFWRQALREAPAEVSAPPDRLRPPIASHRGSVVPIVLDAPLHIALLALARDCSASLFMVLHAALAVLLSRLGAGTDIPIGTPVAGRTDAALDDLIGFFANTLVIRSDLSGRPSFRTAIRRTRAAALAAYAHQDAPFERVVEAVQPERSLSRHPLFQVALALQNAPSAEVVRPALTLSHVPIQTGVSRFDLAFSVEEGRDGAGAPMGLTVLLEYSTDLFHEASAERLIGRFARLLRAAVASPDAPVHTLAILDPDERRQVIQEFNVSRPPTRESRPAGEPGGLALTPDLVAWQAAHNGSGLAVVGDAGGLTYSQLDRRANLVARKLQARGVAPEDRVAVALGRSPRLIVALLGVLKAGAAYVTLDAAAAPPARLRYVLADSGATLVLADRSTLAHLDVGTLPDGVQVVDVESWGGDEAVTPPPVPLHPEGMAYVIYTSGSTGHPKGVGISHRALLNLVTWHLEAFHVTSRDRASQVASMTFDASVWEIWPSLAAGAELHLADEATRRSPLDMAAWLIARSISIAFLPTPLAEQMLDYDWSGASLRFLLVGGDRLRRWPPPGLPFTLVNNYGPTENTVVATSCVVPARVDEQGAPPLGQAIDGTRIYLLDEQGEPVPVGTPGEVWLGGDNLARGYIGRADLTAERFMPDALSGASGARLYRTGDLGRWQADGTVDFLGRLDRQVKLRGVRIELGEIEAALASHPEVEQAAAVMRGDSPAMLAYVVSPRDPEPAALRAYLRERLPEAMVPAAIVRVPELPITASGKVDYAMLPTTSQPDPGRAPAPARTPGERMVAAIWSQVLGVEAVGVEDNFFDVGGHSLNLVEVHTRLQHALGRDIPLVDLFRYPTVADLARYVELPPQAGDQVVVGASERGRRQRLQRPVDRSPSSPRQ